MSAARKALPGWSGATAYNRGQVLYRVAELLEGRAEQFAAEFVKAAGVSPGEAESVVAGAIDRWVWYAGWPDKIGQVDGAANPVAGPYFNLSVPEPTGVVALLAPPGASLLALVSVLAPVIATGNTVVLVASETAPLAAISLAEVLATSDVPGGVVNVLTGRSAELAPVLAAHMDVNAIDLTGAAPGDRAGLERLAAGNVKRVFAAGAAGWPRTGRMPRAWAGCWPSWKPRPSGTPSAPDRPGRAGRSDQVDHAGPCMPTRCCSRSSCCGRPWISPIATMNAGMGRVTRAGCATIRFRWARAFSRWWMCGTRCARTGLTGRAGQARVRDYISKRAGADFDPNVVEQFLKMNI